MKQYIIKDLTTGEWVSNLNEDTGRYSTTSNISEAQPYPKKIIEQFLRAIPVRGEYKLFKLTKVYVV